MQLLDSAFAVGPGRAFPLLLPVAYLVRRACEFVAASLGRVGWVNLRVDVERAVNVLKIELIDTDGHLLAEIPTLVAATLNRSNSLIAGGILPSPPFAEEAHKLVVQMNETLDPTSRDDIVREIEQRNRPDGTDQAEGDGHSLLRVRGRRCS